MSTNEFIEACNTYRCLRDKGYPERATLKLVGDKHRLSRIQRNCLFRGVIDSAAAAGRMSKLVAPGAVTGQRLALDWYNILITVESYLRGQVLFTADDGVVRDASETHGSYRTGPLTVRSIEAIVAEVASIGPSRVDVYLDAPIAFSGHMAEEVRGRCAGLPFPAEVTLAPSADYPLKAYAGIVATSDSVVLDSSTSALDLAAEVIAGRFGVTPPAVEALFPESRGSPPQ